MEEMDKLLEDLQKANVDFNSLQSLFWNEVLYPIEKSSYHFDLPTLFLRIFLLKYR